MHHDNPQLSPKASQRPASFRERALALFRGCAAVHTFIAKGNLVRKPWVSGATPELQ